MKFTRGATLTAIPAINFFFTVGAGLGPSLVLGPTAITASFTGYVDVVGEFTVLDNGCGRDLLFSAITAVGNILASNGIVMAGGDNTALACDTTAAKIVEFHERK